MARSPPIWRLASYALYRRQRLKMPRWEAAQLILGLAIPPLLMGHIIGTRLAYELYGLQNTYTYVDLVLWVFAPEKLWQQIAVLVVAWVHGTIGMHFWLRLKPGYRRVLPLVYAVALLLPVVSLLGFVEGGREVRELAANPDWLATAVEAIHFPADADVAFLLWLTDILFYGYFGLLAAVLAARIARAWWQRSRGMTRISYPRWPGRGEPARRYGARGEPGRRHSPRLGLRRPGPVLDLPGARRGRAR